MQISAGLWLPSDGAITGVITGTPPALPFPGGTRRGEDLEFPDLVDFVAAVRGLHDDGVQVEGMPLGYAEWLVASRGAGEARQMDWDAVPEETAAVIKPHQRACIEAAINLHGGRSLIGLGMGTGKTLIGCLLAVHYGPRILLIVPKAVVTKWRAEFSKWTGLPRPSVLKSGSDANVGQCVVTTFEMCKANRAVLSTAWDVVVVDECHNLKGADTVRSREIIPLLRRTPAVVLLSGTPVENSPGELFGVMSALHPRVFRDRKTFTARYADGKIGRRGVWEETGAKNLDELAALVGKTMYRDWKIKPVDVPFARIMVKIKPKDAQARVLAQLRSRQRELCTLEARAMDDGAKLRVKRMQDLHSNLMWKTNGELKVPLIGDWIDLLIQSNPDRKIAFFTQFVETTEAVRACVQGLVDQEQEGQGGEVEVITGETSTKERDRIVQGLQQIDSGPRYAVCTIGTCREGIDLCPGVSLIVFVEMHGTPTKMLQTEGRAFRIGAVRDVTAYWLILTGSSDEQIMEKVQRRNSNNVQILDGNKRVRLGFDQEGAEKGAQKGRNSQVLGGNKRARVDKEGD